VKLIDLARRVLFTYLTTERENRKLILAIIRLSESTPVINHQVIDLGGSKSMLTQFNFNMEPIAGLQIAFQTAAICDPSQIENLEVSHARVTKIAIWDADQGAASESESLDATSNAWKMLEDIKADAVEFGPVRT